MKLALKTLVTGLIIAVLPAGPCHGDLIARWSGNNTAMDATGNGHDGTVNSATYSAGQFGNAFSFDGSGDSVIVAADPDLEPGNLSVSLWVQAVSETHYRLLADSTHGASSAGWALQIRDDNLASFAFGNGTGFPEVIGTTNVADGAFHHIAATMDGFNLRIYVDGNLENTFAYSGSPLASGRDIQLGNHLSVSGRDFQGLLDDVQLYDETLNQAQITNLFNGLAVPEPGTAGLAGMAIWVAGSWRRRR